MLRALSFAFALLAGHEAAAVECERVSFEGNGYTICTVDMARDDLRLFLYDKGTKPYGQFTHIDDALARDGLRLAFAMNGGMYHDNRSPVGHYLENGTEIMRVVPNAGPGNFGLLPNGVLCIGASRVDVIETRRYLEETPDCAYASQSGPMLVINGALHPKFLAESTSRYIRNGVGTSADGREAVFAISDNGVTFHEFAVLFRDGLNLPQALFLEGNVSRLHAPDLGRSDLGRRMGPVVGVVEQIPSN